MIYLFTASPDRSSEGLPIKFYTEDEHKVREAALFWEQANWTVKVTYSCTSWVPFDYKSNYRFSGGYTDGP